MGNLQAILAILAVAMMAGCSAPKATTSEPPATETMPPPSVATPLPPPKAIEPASGLRVVSEKVDVSIRGHRTSEFTVARNPLDTRNLLAAGMDWDSANSVVQCTAFVSKDGGLNWTAIEALPGHAGTREDTDPWVAFDHVGRAYLTCTEAGVGLLLGESEDGGLTWGLAKPIPTGGIPAKDSIGAFDDGNLFVCFQQGILQIMHSSDRGLTWQQFGMKDILAGCNGIVRGPDGIVYVMWQGGGAIEADRPQPPPPALGVAYSRDNGKSWASTLIHEDLGSAPTNLPIIPQAAAPSLAVSPITGTVFVGAQRYQNAEVLGPVATESTANIMLVRSKDQGLTFQELPLPTFASEECLTCNQVHPTLTVDDKGRLVLQVTLSSSDSIRKEIWVAVSNDEGETWLPSLILGKTFLDESYLEGGNFLPNPNELVEGVAEILEDPSPQAITAHATGLTWAVTHRDGGEYFGITTNGDTIIDLWVQHDGEGKNRITARQVQILQIGT